MSATLNILNLLLTNPVVLDVETTISNKGNAFDVNNKLVTIQIKQGDSPPIILTKENFSDSLGILNNASCIIGSNIKFDLHWLQRELGFKASCLWCCQLAEFIFSKQTWKYPDLATMCTKYDVQQKLDIVKTEYWNRSCSCHVSVVNQILNCMRKEFVSLVMIENINELDLVEHLKSAYGENLTQKSMRLLNKGDVKNYLLVWKHRLEQDELNIKTSTNLQMLSMIESWLKQYVQFVDQQTGSQLTTPIAQEKFEIVCVSLVTQLWDMLKTQTGWLKHSNTCKPTVVDTDQIPLNILFEYGAGDVESTWQVFCKQVELFKTVNEHQFKLFRVHCNDLLVLQEMEYNGILYAVPESLTQAEGIVKQVNHLEEKLYAFTGGVPINFDSRDHTSVLLYGGKITEQVRIPVGVYKTGAKTGEPRYKILIKEYELPAIVQPLKNSALKKEGYYSTEEATLVSLKPTATAKKVITWLLERSKLMKLKSTYLEGMPKVIALHNWADSMLHSSLNNCLTITGRLSSSKPNQQNFPKECKRHCITRY